MSGLKITDWKYEKIILVCILFLSTLFSCGDNSGKSQSTALSQENQTESQPNSGTVGKESGYKKELEWTAYKTNKKVPVTGTFLKISLTNVKEDRTFPESLEGSMYFCDGTTVSTGDTARDGTLTTFFFKRLSSPQITGSFGKFESGKVPVTMVLNGKTITKEFTYTVQGDKVTIKGSFDILKDFNAEKPFTSLHRACYDLHEGKTWTEVDISVKISK